MTTLSGSNVYVAPHSCSDVMNVGRLSAFKPRIDSALAWAANNHSTVISRRVRRHDQKTYIDFPIQLDGTAKPLEIAAPGTIQNARRDAEQVAKALRLPLADHTGPTQIVREAEHLDESLRERR